MTDVVLHIPIERFSAIIPKSRRREYILAFLLENKDKAFDVEGLSKKFEFSKEQFGAWIRYYKSKGYVFGLRKYKDKVFVGLTEDFGKEIKADVENMGFTDMDESKDVSSDYNGINNNSRRKISHSGRTKGYNKEVGE